MTTQLSLFSEPFAPTGAMAAKGLKESLGRPSLDTLVLLVREAVQNSWDARLPGGEAVRFELDGRTIQGEELDSWKSVLSTWPANGLPLAEVLERPAFDVLFVSDRGTCGLTGPTRADKIAKKGARDFVDFMRNVGQPRDTHLGGGTYGYGKSIFFVASEASTIIVYTRIRSGDRYVTRLMGAALGDNHEADGRPFTGRHWWGELRDGVIEPMEGADADEIAIALGFPEFGVNETGTSIALVGFFGLDDGGDSRGLEESCAVMAEAVAWYCWPKFGMSNRADEVEFVVRANGQTVRVPDDRDFPVLALFRRALSVAQGWSSDDSSGRPHEIRSRRPKQLLGVLGIEKGLKKQNRSPSYVSPLPENSHHIALMRSPLLIVKYDPGTPVPSSQMEWAGAFVVDPGVDDAFAKAEPPAHDDWISSGLERPAKVFVNVAPRRIRETVDEQLAIGRHGQREGERVPLGALSNRLGSLLALAPGIGARGHGSNPSSPPPTPKQRSRKKPAIDTGTPRLVVHNGVRSLAQEFVAQPGKEALLTVLPRVIVDSGRPEDEPPVGAEEPQLVHLEFNGSAVPTTGAIEISGTVRGTAIVSVPDDTMVRVDFHLEETDVE